MPAVAQSGGGGAGEESGAEGGGLLLPAVVDRRRRVWHRRRRSGGEVAAVDVGRRWWRRWLAACRPGALVVSGAAVACVVTGAGRGADGERWRTRRRWRAGGRWWCSCAAPRCRDGWSQHAGGRYGAMGTAGMDPVSVGLTDRAFCATLGRSGRERVGSGRGRRRVVAGTSGPGCAGRAGDPAWAGGVAGPVRRRRCGVTRRRVRGRSRCRSASAGSAGCWGRRRSRRPRAATG